ncbi:MAG: 2-C-methyl-D-erythritol 2,4-cyclodiphosphate synthase [Syntrophorhabdaceae bacterium PtaU1.Bin034]|nr:MAG: 2-C-methyl-D-erythritol 2,4-cyclodiphosphate synthase [Syntrophorhabdaceae bacterium PtaU1.Bin034]
MRIGLGYDAHAFVEGRDLFLGGLLIPHDKGLLGHSDGDVLLHAISDAVLGAAGLADIGFHFPNTDESIEGIQSEKILARVVELVRSEGYEIVNVDAVVVCQVPKIQPYREQMRENIGRVMGIVTTRINVKGKTTEGMGFPGRKEGIESYAVCLLE